MRVIAVVFSSSAAKAGVRAGWAVRKVFVPAARPAKEWMFVPALLLLGLIIAVQRRRRRT
jgi:hypothetical protein